MHANANANANASVNHTLGDDCYAFTPVEVDINKQQ
jgi:hypothetical protein